MSGTEPLLFHVPEPAWGIGTVEKSGVPPGRTAGSGTWNTSGSVPLISFSPSRGASAR